MKKYKYLILIIIASLMIVVLLIFNYYYFSKFISYKKIADKNAIMSNLETILIDYAEEVYPEDPAYTYTGTVSTILNLEQIKDYYSKDVSMFNTKEIKCDLTKTHLEITITNKVWSYKASLACE